jgi:hypothetical protein
MSSKTAVKFSRPEAGRYTTQIDGDTFVIWQGEYPCIGGTYWGVTRHYENGDSVVLANRRNAERPGFRYLADAKSYVTEIVEVAR